MPGETPAQTPNRVFQGRTKSAAKADIAGKPLEWYNNACKYPDKELTRAAGYISSAIKFYSDEKTGGSPDIKDANNWRE